VISIRSDLVLAKRETLDGPPTLSLLEALLPPSVHLRLKITPPAVLPSSSYLASNDMILTPGRSEARRPPVLDLLFSII